MDNNWSVNIWYYPTHPPTCHEDCYNWLLNVCTAQNFMTNSFLFLFFLKCLPTFKLGLLSTMKARSYNFSGSCLPDAGDWSSFISGFLFCFASSRFNAAFCLLYGMEKYAICTCCKTCSSSPPNLTVI